MMDWLDTAFIYQVTLSPLWVFLKAESRVFWLFLLSSFFLVVVFLWQADRLSIKSIKQTLFSTRYWFHPSSRKDVGLLFLNAWVKVFILVPLLAGHLAGIVFVSTMLQRHFSDAPSVALSYTAIMLLFSVVFFVTEDFSRFYLHRLMHKVPILWRLHKTHHSAEVLTPLTLFRVHPLEMCLYQIRQLVVISVVGGIFVWFFGGKVSGLSILGVDAFGFLFNFLGANLRHSHIPLSFGRFEKWFVSPAQHQIHHSSDPVHFNKNFGTCFALWDRVFNCWYQGVRTQKLSVGLR